MGYVVVTPEGVQHEAGCFAFDPEYVEDPLGLNLVDREWVREHVPSLEVTHHSLSRLRTDFWDVWRRWRRDGAWMAADVPWPVEARFLAACVDDCRPLFHDEGPYPLVDIASVRLAAGLDPLGTEARLDDEQPAHCLLYTSPSPRD